MSRVSNDNDWNSRMGIRHSTKSVAEGATKQPLVQVSPPNPKILASMRCRAFLALYIILPFLLLKMIV